jgi:hypothetical protein
MSSSEVSPVLPPLLLPFSPLEPVLFGSARVSSSTLSSSEQPAVRHAAISNAPISPSDR